MRGHVAVVGLGAVEVLDQVIPHVPFPDDLAALGIGGLHLDDRVGEQLPVAQHLGIETGGEALVVGFLLDDQQQDVAVGQGGDVVMREMLVVRILELPHEVAGPVEFLDAAAFAAAGEAAVLGEATMQEVAVGFEVDRLARLIVALPLVHDTARVVHEVDDGVVLRREQGVAGGGLGGVQEQAHGLPVRPHAGVVLRPAISRGRSLLRPAASGGLCRSLGRLVVRRLRPAFRRARDRAFLGRACLGRAFRV